MLVMRGAATQTGVVKKQDLKMTDKENYGSGNYDHNKTSVSTKILSAN